MADINFKPLFDYLDEQFGEFGKQFDDLRSNLFTLQISVDNIVKDYGSDALSGSNSEFH